ncbi:MAG: SAM hydrolase/SAM-dependent halogenase family protein [Gemmataceae bacterium]
MSDPIITLTTDFGTASPFVAAMKGVILSINPSARIVDLSHDIPPYDVRHAAFFLAEALPLFPPDTVHVAVVDPEVGSGRAVLFVQVAGQRLLVPDNGVWTLLAHGHTPRVRQVTQSRYFRPAVSATFHGRDIFAPVAASLSLGVSPEQLGPAVTSWRGLDWPASRRLPDGVEGEVVFVDRFGNLITNLSVACVAPAGERPWRVTAGGVAVPKRVRTYHDGVKGELVALISSGGMLEVAEVQGDAARRLALGVGAAVRVGW